MASGETQLFQHIAERDPDVISGCFIYYAVAYYIKLCLCLSSLSSRSRSMRLPASGLFHQWEDNPSGIPSFGGGGGFDVTPQNTQNY